MGRLRGPSHTSDVGPVGRDGQWLVPWPAGPMDLNTSVYRFCPITQVRVWGLGGLSPLSASPDLQAQEATVS